MNISTPQRTKVFWFIPLMTHQVQPGTHDSPEASRAAHLLTLEWEPVKSLGLCRLTATAPALDGALLGGNRQL